MTAIPLPRAIDFRLPRVSRVALICFIWLLPFHSLVVAFLFGYVGLSAGIVRAIAAWKEAAVVLLFVWVLLRAALSRGPRAVITAADVAVAALIGIALAFMIVANPILYARLPVGAELYGFRDSVFFMLLYFVGRSTPELAESDIVLKHAFFLALVVSAVGIIERIFVSPDTLVLLGVASYMNEFLGLSAYTAGNAWGLPQNYWSIIGGIPVRRAGSVFLHSQGFALAFLFLMPAATAWILNRKRRHPVLLRIGYGIIWIGLLLSITRMTIVICFVQVVLFYVMVRRTEWAIGSIVTAIALGAIAMVVVPGLLHFAWQTLSWQTGSNESHLKNWTQGTLAFLEQPWGHGLGTTDAAPLRFLRQPLSADNMYFSYAVQLGIAGIFALIAALGSILATTWRVVWTETSEDRRRFAAAIALTTLGILANGMTSFVFSSTFLAYVFFWLAGAAVTMSQRVRAESRQ